MFKKLKDKLAEEVKSSPNRIQQFAQAAQAAVTSASSSISDITNNDLFSIADNDNSTKTQLPNTSQNLNQSSTNSSDFADFSMGFENRQRQRRLSNSSFASDISFQLPKYESPSMYHLQSDMDMSASEAEEIGNVNLNRVTKEQLYAAYKRTQERWKKYKTQYSDLARHYKLLERENAKARNVLVETQDKALRRISELKEQCSLEQSAKAHLEQALRVDLEEKDMKINSLCNQMNIQNDVNKNDAQMQLINLNDDNTNQQSDVNKKIEKLEELLNKYKESLKVSKNRNSLLETEMQKLKINLDTKTKENNDLQQENESMKDRIQTIQELNNKIERLENLNSTLEFTKNKDVSILESNLCSSQEEIAELQKKIKILSKREEEYAISLAENKLRIHKELESKEAEIKTLNDSLTAGYAEIETLEATVKEHKDQIQHLEADIHKLNNDVTDLSAIKVKLNNLNKEYDNLKDKSKALENFKAKCEEDINCLHLQLKQETAEKLSVIDRNVYLESRNTQLTDENTKKRSQINKLEEEVALVKREVNDLKNTLSEQEDCGTDSGVVRLTEEATAWKMKCTSLESEIQEERVELGKLQSEIEKLLTNHGALQHQNIELNAVLDKLQSENMKLYNEVDKYKAIRIGLAKFKNGLTDVRGVMASLTHESRSINEVMKWIPQLKDGIDKQQSLAYTRIKHLEDVKTSLEEQIVKITLDYENLIKDGELIKIENEQLKLSLQESESKCLNSKLKDDEIKDLHQLENIELRNKIKILEEETGELRKELSTINELNKSCSRQIESLTTEKLNTSKREHDENMKHTLQLEENLERMKQENAKLISSKTETEELHEKLESDLNELKSTHSKKESDYEALKNEYDREISKQHELQEKCEKLQSELLDLTTTIESLKDENNNLQLLKEDKEKRLVKMEAEMNQARESYDRKLRELNEDSFKSSQIEITKLREDYERQVSVKEAELHEVRESYECKIKQLNEDNTSLKSTQSEISMKVTKSEERIKEMNKQFDQQRESYECKIKDLDKENESLKTKQTEILENLTQESDKQIKMEAEIQRIHESYKNKLKQSNEENVTLKSLQESTEKQFRDIETELNQVRDSYETKLKDMNNEIDSLRSTESDLNKKMQKAEIELSEIYQKYNELDKKKVELDNVIIDLETKIISHNKVIHEQQMVISSHKTCECDGLREENRRLSSDVEGLQTYLTKISKENGELNDKLREVLSSENSSDNDLKADIQFGKDKIEALLRENSLLIEENLELKDQIQNNTQTRTSSNELNTTKYKLLEEEKNNLILKANELEVMNDSLNRAMDQNQNNNERLKLSNEKLQRKLDEALVSLRHLHALEENTELEYLRNILYEYLTGPGSHSLTLAKVLAAVVKFDDRQTEQVLVKEKERQGFLHQLGII